MYCQLFQRSWTVEFLLKKLSFAFSMKLFLDLYNFFDHHTIFLLTPCSIFSLSTVLSSWSESVLTPGLLHLTLQCLHFTKAPLDYMAWHRGNHAPFDRFLLPSLATSWRNLRAWIFIISIIWGIAKNKTLGILCLHNNLLNNIFLRSTCSLNTGLSSASL
jgi:hypothetical protein